MVELCSKLTCCGANNPARSQQGHRRVGTVSTPVSRAPFSAPLSQKSRALHLARAQQFAPARLAFQTLLEEWPEDVGAWISWAQMEKRDERACGDTGKYPRCRLVLQRALTHNLQNLSGAAQLCQAWGLLELQRGNMWAAVSLLERASSFDPRCSPVLQWRPVQLARAAVGQRQRRKAEQNLCTSSE